MTEQAGTILIVDDHVDLAENLAEILAGAGYETDIAPSAEAGLARIERGGVGSLITDYRLPGMSGADLIAELRRRGNRIPAVLISAFTDDETVGRARAAGAADVLAKPVPLDRLLALVASMSQRHLVVLIVEDNHALAENMLEAMRAHGHRAIACGSLAEVRALPVQPQAAIVDYRLPDGTGVDVAQELLARDPRIRILFVSGHGAELQTRLRGPLAASAAQLEKPVNVERLLAWVAEAADQPRVTDGATERPRR